jgi:hypothetical protein
MKVLFAAVVSLFVFAATGVLAEETPQEGLKAIDECYKTKNFDKLVKERYAELHKCKNANEVQQVIDMFKKRFSNDKILKQISEIHAKALQVKPEISTNKHPQESETDKMAKFKVDKITIRLYLLKTGKWGFHM